MEVTHTVYQCISPSTLERISGYRAVDVTPARFADPSTWDDLQKIVVYHPDPITRHEASFVIGELQPPELVPWLYSVAKFDRSIVATHEAIEALGRTRGPARNWVISRLERLRTVQEDRIQHLDIQATFNRALAELRASL